MQLIPLRGEAGAGCASHAGVRSIPVLVVGHCVPSRDPVIRLEQRPFVVIAQFPFVTFV